MAQFVFICAIVLLPNDWQRQTRQQLLSFGLSLVAIFLLCIPMFLVSLHGPKTGWLPIPSRSDVIYIISKMSGDSHKYLLALVVFCLLAVVLVVGSAFVSRQLETREKTVSASVQSWLEARQYLPFCLALLCWFILPFLISYGVSFSSLRLFSSRYLVVIIPPLCPLVALSVANIRWRWVQLVLSVVLIGLALSSVPYYYRSAQVEDWNSSLTGYWTAIRPMMVWFATIIL